jgi:CRP/FNR family transcriptional regulator, cyclic AMP receptor protein
MADDSLFSRFGREFPQGAVLFREGDVGKEMYVIQAGRITVSKHVRDVEKVLGTLGQGDFVGEMAIISNKPRSATATVAEEAKLLVIDSRTFEAMVRANSEIAVRMIKKLTERLQDADRQIENLLLADPTSRLVHFLMHQVAARGGTDGVHVDFSVKELPPMLGLREEQIRDTLIKLEKAKLATLDSDGAVISSLQKMKEYFDFLEMKAKFSEL